MGMLACSCSVLTTAGAAATALTLPSRRPRLGHVQIRAPSPRVAQEPPHRGSLTGPAASRPAAGHRLAFCIEGQRLNVGYLSLDAQRRQEVRACAIARSRPNFPEWVRPRRRVSQVKRPKWPCLPAKRTSRSRPPIGLTLIPVVKGRTRSEGLVWGGKRNGGFGRNLI